MRAARPGSAWIVAASIVTASIVSAPADVSAAQPPLIPRSIVLEESERGNPVLSPDGTLIAYSAPYRGVVNLWVKSVGKSDDRVVTDQTDEAIYSCFWQADGAHLLYLKDSAGDENTHLFQTDIRTRKTRDLTPLAGARVKSPISDARHPDTLLLHINARDRRFFDLYRLDLGTSTLSLDTVNPGDVVRFYADGRMRARVAEALKPDGSSEVRARSNQRSPWKTLIAWGADETASDATGVVGLSADGRGVLVVTSLDSNTARLIEVDLRSGTRRTLSQDAQYDVTQVMLSPTRRSLEAVAYEKERTSWVFLDRRVQDDFDVLRTVRDGDIEVRSRDRKDRTWLVRYAASNRPTAYYHYDRSTRKARFLFSEDPKLEDVPLAPKAHVHFRASDGLTIFGYLTLPPGVPARDLPLVVRVHGGPWTRDSWNLEFPVQLLANRGYAVLQVNFRGSTGYGKAYQNAGKLEWGGKVIQDLVDGARWAVAQGLADPGRVAVMGGSFGGYAALAALAFHPDEFRCGIAMNAMSDLNLFLASMPPAWTVGRARFETHMGKDPESLRRISPLHAADRIVRPLLLMHNANDVRVTKEHADRLAAALRERGTDVTYLLFPNAGHGSGGVPINLSRRWAAIESFLATHLGGRLEPPTEDERWDSLLR